MAFRILYNDLSKHLFDVFTRDLDGDVIFGNQCFLMGLRALYHGTSGDTRTELECKPFRELFAMQTTHHPPTTEAIALLSRGDVGDIQSAFVTNIIDNCTKHFLHSRIISDEVDTQEKRLRMAKNVNAWFEEHSDGLINGIVNAGGVSMKNGAMSMVIMSIFKAMWETPFTDGTMKSTFFQSNSTVEIDMMLNTTDEFAYVNTIMEKKLKATIVKFPYYNNFGSLIAIMPNEPADKDQLSTILQQVELDTLFQSFTEVECCGQSMPRFVTETQIVLNEGMSRVEGLKHLTRLGADFSNMFEGGIPHECMSFKLKTTIENTEYGTEVVSKMEVDAFDGVLKGRNICLNKPFLYFIVNTDSFIYSIGMFLGE